MNITVNANTAPITVHTGDPGTKALPSANARRRGILVERSPSPSARTVSSATSLGDPITPVARPSFLHPSAYAYSAPSSPQSPRPVRPAHGPIGHLDADAKARRLAIIEETFREMRAEHEAQMRSPRPDTPVHPTGLDAHATQLATTEDIRPEGQSVWICVSGEPT